jgi:site-specific recombinase XerD
MRFVPYASSAVKARPRLTSSSRSAADQMSTIGFHHLIQRLGKAARMPFPLHPHMLRHACGYKLANDGHDTRALQHYLGHKNIQHTVRYTELSPDRFRDFWRD